MSYPTDAELIHLWQDKPAPLLALLNAFHDRDHYVSEEAMKAISAGLRIPLADLYGTVTFYHHFAREAPGQQAPRVCVGPICCLQGGREILEALKQDGATPMPCAGRCDQPVPVLQAHRVLVGKDLEDRPSPLPVPNPEGYEECIFAGIREPDRRTLKGYRQTGGYEGLQHALRLEPDGVSGVIERSQLAGRGGAGFPTGTKWKAVHDAVGIPKTIVCNADEGEPGCFKDRAIMDYDPFAVIEGMTLAAYATGATRGFIYLRYEYPETFEVLQKAIEAAESAGLLGSRILGEDFEFQIHLRRGGGAYICGEETSLLNSLEGKHPFPRNRPPYPVTHGFEDLPTVVNNVETLAATVQILRHGADWYRGLGLNDQAGTKVVSLSGDVQRPGNYEVPLGFPLQTLLEDWAGGPQKGKTIQAVTMAGLSGGFLAGEDLKVTLDEPSLREKGSFLASGGIMVFDHSRDMVEVARSGMDFFAHESCGKCFPCRIGTRRLTERLEGSGPRDLETWITEVKDLGQTMMATSACGLGQAAPKLTESLLKYFPDQVAKHVIS
ncbi:MAG: NAD(P)H-dependent oxidoreductase subunit E [bacterium]|nr:NAD(P)H-dependent oxidoreductase subunit E [bacterium]